MVILKTTWIKGYTPIAVEAVRIHLFNFRVDVLAGEAIEAFFTAVQTDEAWLEVRVNESAIHYFKREMIAKIECMVTGEPKPFLLYENKE